MLKLKEKYQKEVIPAMKEKFGYRNQMAVPKIEKVVINSGFGKMISGASSDLQKKTQEAISADLVLITGQKTILTKAKKSIASFKIRQGMFVGATVTLRKKRMFDFLERLIHIVFPRTRDFQGIKLSSFDRNGNLSVAIREQIVFPEIMPEKTKFIFGLEVTIKTTAKTKEEGIELLRLLGFPLKK